MPLQTRFVELLVGEMSAVELLPGEVLHRQGEVATHLCFVLSGAIQILSGATPSTEATGESDRNTGAFEDNQSVMRASQNVGKSESCMVDQVRIYLQTLPYTRRRRWG